MRCKCGVYAGEHEKGSVEVTQRQAEAGSQTWGTDLGEVHSDRLKEVSFWIDLILKRRKPRTEKIKCVSLKLAGNRPAPGHGSSKSQFSPLL